MPGDPPCIASEEAGPRAGLSKRIHAWMLAHYGARYEALVADRKRALFAALQGDVLEIGPGAGPNLVYYPKTIRWIGVEPNPFMHRYLREAAARAGILVEVRRLEAERLPAADSTMDAVVSTLVLCSVREPDRVL